MASKMIPSIENQFPALPLHSEMSGHGQVRDTMNAPHSASESSWMKAETPPPNDQGESTRNVQYAGGITPTDLKFRIDKNTDQVVVVVLRQDTGEVIREIPLNEPFSVSSTLHTIQPGQVFHAVT